MALAQLAVRGYAKAVEDAVGDVDEPGSQGQQQRRGPGQADVHGAGEAPGPESGYGRGIKREQMPPAHQRRKAKSGPGGGGERRRCKDHTLILRLGISRLPTSPWAQISLRAAWQVEVPDALCGAARGQ